MSLPSRYVVQKELGRGGMGVVYLATDQQLARSVVIKCVLPEAVDVNAIERFDREAQTLASIRHPNVISLFDYSKNPSAPFLVMKYIPGHDLNHWIKTKSPLHEAWLEEIFSGLVSALQACHAKGLVHRDIKPHNILIDGQTETPVLIDFGVVKARRDGLDYSQLTLSQDVVGTPEYMAPEQLSPEQYGKVQPATDIWALGATLFECLTGTTPFQGANAVNIYKKLLTDDIPNVLTINPEASPKLAYLCEQCLQKNPEERIDLDGFQAILDGDYSPERASSGRWPMIAGMTGIIAAVLSLALLFWPRSPTIERFEVQVNKDTGRIDVTGSMSQFAELILEKQAGKTWQEWDRFPSNMQGQFTRSYDVKNQGPLTVRLRMADAAAPQKIIELVVDTEKPKCLSEAGEAIEFVDAFGKQTFKVVDDHPSHVTVNGKRFAISDGQFSLDGREYSVGEPLSVTVFDLGENETQYSWTVHWGARLMRRELWNSSPHSVQDSIIKYVETKLGSDFEHVSTKRYRCNKLSHRIACFKHRDSGVELHLLPGDSYFMGRSDIDAEVEFYENIFRKKANRSLMDSLQLDTSRHKTTVKPFLMARFELSKGIWAKYEKGFKPVAGEAAQMPVNYVSREQAKDWCKRVYKGFRLAHEREWEYANRAGADSRFFWGWQFNGFYSWGSAGEEKRKVRPVDCPEIRNNAFGLKCMTGNVDEWVANDWYPYPGCKLSKAAIEESKKKCVKRGGHYYNSASGQRSWRRATYDNTKGAKLTGFRVAMDIPE